MTAWSGTQSSPTMSRLTASRSARPRQAGWRRTRPTAHGLRSSTGRRQTTTRISSTPAFIRCSTRSSSPGQDQGRRAMDSRLRSDEGANRDGADPHQVQQQGRRRRLRERRHVGWDHRRVEGPGPPGQDEDHRSGCLTPGPAERRPRLPGRQPGLGPQRRSAATGGSRGSPGGNASATGMVAGPAGGGGTGRPSLRR
jgi:hypothetical protein